MNQTNSQRGAVAVYIALIMATAIVSAALVMSAILSRQARFSSDVVSTERAFYSADSGAEAVLYDLKQKIDTGDTSRSEREDSISYGEQEATFSAAGSLSLSQDQTSTVPCLESVGTFARESRRVALGTPDCEIEP